MSVYTRYSRAGGIKLVSMNRVRKSTRASLRRLVAAAFIVGGLLSVGSANGAFADIDASKLRTPVNPQILDRIFEYPVNHKPFDANAWKRSPQTRYPMLFELYHLNLFGKSPNEVHQLLGEPMRIWSSQGNRIDYFDLGTVLGEPVMLWIYYQFDKLNCFRLAQHCETGYGPLPKPDWNQSESQDARQKNAAHEINQQYFLVGAPTALLSQFIDCNAA